MTRVILASASPRRRELLGALVLDFDVIPADVPEPLIGDPHENARRLAADKAAFVARQHPGAIVIGADTIVHLAGVSYGKPRDAADAIRILRELRGRSHQVVTGIAVVPGGPDGLQTRARAETVGSERRTPSPAAAGEGRGEGRGGQAEPNATPGACIRSSVFRPEGLHVSSSETTVHMSDLPDGRLTAYVASGRPLDKAGAYAIQDADIPTVASFDGCYCNVVGLPLWRLRGLLGPCGLETRQPHLSITRCAECPERDASPPSA